MLLKHLTQQVAHVLSNDNAPSTITQGKTGKIQNSVLQTYWVHQQWQRFEEDVDYVMPLTARALNPVIDNSAITLEGYGASEIQKAQENDSDLGVIIQWLRGGESTQGDLQLQSWAVKRLWRHKDQLSIRGNVLRYVWVNDDGTESHKLLVPTSLRQELLQLCHDSKGEVGAIGAGTSIGKDKPIVHLAGHEKGRRSLHKNMPYLQHGQVKTYASQGAHIVPSRRTQRASPLGLPRPF